MDEPDDKNKDTNKKGTNIDTKRSAGQDSLHPQNLSPSERARRKAAVAITSRAKADGDKTPPSSSPKISASGHGHIAEQILELAFENDVRVREDADLAELLAYLDIDTPIPTEALEAIAEILSYVYQANGQPNPFDAVLKNAMTEEIDDNQGENDENK